MSLTAQCCRLVENLQNHLISESQVTDVIFRIHFIDVFLSLLEIVNQVRLTIAEIYWEM
jgi:hypothetical protein